MTSPALPPYIALCGKPTAGKTTVAEVLDLLYGYKLADDGQFLRQIAMNQFGLSYHQVHTQAGKLEKVVINGEEMTVRDVLGRIGNGFEQQFGANVIPELAHKTLKPGQRYVFGSVRREQAAYHKSRGALVIEVQNQFATPSPYEFDQYNPAHIDLAIVNDFNPAGGNPMDAKYLLQRHIDMAISRYLRPLPVA